MKTIAIGTSETEQLLIHIHRYGNTEADNPYDDYLEIEITAVIGGLSAHYYGRMLAIELDKLSTQTRELYDTLAGNIKFQTIEHHLDISFSVDRTGHIHISGDLQEEPHQINRLTFDLSYDQTQFEKTVRSIESAARAFPRRT